MQIFRGCALDSARGAYSAPPAAPLTDGEGLTAPCQEPHSHLDVYLRKVKVLVLDTIDLTSWRLLRQIGNCPLN